MNIESRDPELTRSPPTAVDSDKEMEDAPAASTPPTLPEQAPAETQIDAPTTEHIELVLFNTEEESTENIHTQKHVSFAEPDTQQQETVTGDLKEYLLRDSNSGSDADSDDSSTTITPQTMHNKPRGRDRRVRPSPRPRPPRSPMRIPPVHLGDGIHQDTEDVGIAPFPPKGTVSRKTKGRPGRLTMSMTLTYPRASYDLIPDNPGWSLVRIRNSVRLHTGPDSEVVKYLSVFIFTGHTKRLDKTGWQTFEQLNKPWGIRMLRLFHARNPFKPKDPRIDDPKVIATEWKGQRREWFNGVDPGEAERAIKQSYLAKKAAQKAAENTKTAGTKSLVALKTTTQRQSPQGGDDVDDHDDLTFNPNDFAVGETRIISNDELMALLDSDTNLAKAEEVHNTFQIEIKGMIDDTAVRRGAHELPKNTDGIEKEETSGEQDTEVVKRSSTPIFKDLEMESTDNSSWLGKKILETPETTQAEGANTSDGKHTTGETASRASSDLGELSDAFDASTISGGASHTSEKKEVEIGTGTTAPATEQGETTTKQVTEQEQNAIEHATEEEQSTTEPTSESALDDDEGLGEDIDNEGGQGEDQDGDHDMGVADDEQDDNELVADDPNGTKRSRDSAGSHRGDLKRAKFLEPDSPEQTSLVEDGKTEQDS
ncbi:hypothetical protein TWF696_002481 [Orbilia brochopaga]|uniref:Fork-head domain-containing protein n=1 Tax=Orbilia brochopaga TaxID=3140254 RepID=A0AAV9U617_9PEZI